MLLEAGHFDMDDYIDYVMEFINFYRTKCSHYGSLPTCCSTACRHFSLMSESNSPNVPSSMILMGGPIDARKNPTVVDEFAQSKSLEWFCQMVTM